MIHLTREQANRVRGLTTRGHSLSPVPLADGTFVLPETVLRDPAHAKFHAGLAALPRIDITDADLHPDLDERLRYDYSPDWPEGELIER